MKITKNDVMRITEDDVEAVELAVGMGHGAWDCVDPKEIIAAAYKVMDEHRFDGICLSCFGYGWNNEWNKSEDCMQSMTCKKCKGTGRI